MGLTYSFELRGKLDEAHLKEAWKLVQKEYPYARTVIRVVVGEVSFAEDAQVPQFPGPPCLNSCITLS